MADVEEKEGGFLARWSERKIRIRGGIDPGGVPSGPGADPAVASEEEATEAEDAPVLTDADMPTLESLDEGSDYSGFLSPGVSEELRRKALSTLFHSAGFNIADGLDDYDEDFTKFLPLGDIITSDMRHQMEEAAKGLLADEERVAEVDDASKEKKAADAVVAAPREAEIDADADEEAGEGEGEGEGRADGEPV